MTDPSIPEPLASILTTYCDVNAIEMVDFLHDDLVSGQIAPEKARLFRQQLLETIEHQTLTPAYYKALTGENEYTTQEALQAWLRELWATIYPEDTTFS